MMMKTNLLSLLRTAGCTLLLMVIAGCQALPKDQAPPQDPVFKEFHPYIRGYGVPDKAGWTATASALQDEFFPAEFVCDGDYKTRWSSPSEDDHWVQIDMGERATICGFVINWETAFSSAYRIETSLDGEKWQMVYETQTGDGRTDNININPVVARYFRIHGIKRATGWGHSIWEVSVKGPEDCIAVSAGEEKALSLTDGQLLRGWVADNPAQTSILIDLRKPTEFGGIRIDWGDVYATSFEMYLSADEQSWRKAAYISQGTGGFDLLLHPKEQAQYIRLDFLRLSEPNGLVQIRDITIRGPDEVLTPLAGYELAAKKAPPGLYPDQLRGRQVYWTVIGLPGDSEESLLDEYGNFEPIANRATLMPYLFMNGELRSALNADAIDQHLESDYLPIPSTHWMAGQVELETKAFTSGSDEDSVSFIRYRLSNTSDTSITGRLFLAVRPIQVNPPWQYGGLTHVSYLELVRGEQADVVRVNDEDLFICLDKPDGFGARYFDFGDIANNIVRGELPAAQKLQDPDGLASGALAYDFNLGPNDSRTVIVASPLHRNRAYLDQLLAQHPDANALYNLEFERMRDQWIDWLDDVELALPQDGIAETVLSQIAYILINQDGPAIQPGSRNYNRSWIRDGGVTSIALMRMGLLDEARTFVEWYSERVQEDGLVPPILNTDGTINEGFGSNLEYDSQGQFIYAVTEYYRYTRDQAFLEKHFDRIKRALEFTQRLRERTLEPGYMGDVEAPERFHGILPPSISHEGYSEPMHSYWDDFWALRGWKDGAYAATILGNEEVAAWAREQHDLLYDSVRKSIERTMAYKDIDYIPGSADLGDFDATSTAIAFFHCDTEDVMPRDGLQTTFDRYFADLQKRLEDTWSGRFTPYEIRSVLAFVALNHNDRAKALLDYLHDSRRPPNWNHLAEVVISDYRIGSYIGDMPHTWVGSGYVNSIRGMLVQEEGSTLHLLPGTPATWVAEGDGVLIKNLPTHFGRLDIAATKDQGEMNVLIGGNFQYLESIRLHWPSDTKPQSVQVNGADWTAYDETGCDLPLGTFQVTARW